jgi:hypothetical protein
MTHGTRFTLAALLLGASAVGDRNFKRYFGQPSSQGASGGAAASMTRIGRGGGVNDPEEGGKLCHRVGYDSAMGCWRVVEAGQVGRRGAGLRA